MKVFFFLDGNDERISFIILQVEIFSHMESTLDGAQRKVRLHLYNHSVCRIGFLTLYTVLAGFSSRIFYKDTVQCLIYQSSMLYFSQCGDV